MFEGTNRLSRRLSVASLGLLGLIGVASGAKADDQPATWHGFFTSGVAFTNSSQSYNGGLSRSADIERLTRVGLNIEKSLDARWGYAAQLIANGKTIKPDWAFVSWYPMKDLTLRIGKQKAPMWLVSDHIDVGRTYPWVTPPEEVYSFNPVKRSSGFGATYRLALGGIEAVADGLYSASSTDTLDVVSGTKADSALDVKVHYRRLAVVNLVVGNDAFQVRGVYAKAAVGIKTDYYQIHNLNAGFGAAGLKVETHGFLLLSEYATIFGKVDQSEVVGARENLVAAATSAATLGAKAQQTGSAADIQAATAAGLGVQGAALQDAAVSQLVGSRGWYATTGYNIGAVMPYVTYASLKNPENSHIVSQGSQVSASGGIKYDANAYTDIKLQGQHVWPKDGTRGIQDVDPSRTKYPQLNVFQAVIDVAF